MDKHEQIIKLEQAYSLITEVINARDGECEIAIELQLAANIVADLSDEIEGVEQE